MNKSLVIRGVALSVLASLMATGVSAADAPKYKSRVGITNVNPKSSNGTIAVGILPGEPTGLSTDVQDDTMLTFNGVYMVTENIGIELLAALPFDHEIEASGAVLGALGEIGSTKHLPPTLSAQYYFNNSSAFTPYVGLGINYTLFFQEELTSGAATLLSGQLGTTVNTNDISLSNSVGFAYQVGVDYDINENMLINLDVRKMDIDTDVKIIGVDVGEVKIDPTVISLNFGYKYR